jgi:acyl-CoA thioester hydrolase
MPRLCPPIIERLRPVARVRVLYADTDKMGIAYHAAYLRYMELGRVELIRGAGLPYTAMESQGLALPLTDIAVRYSSPALYDDRMTIHIGLSLVTPVRVHFDYRILVEAGDRQGVQHDVEILTAQTRHACVRGGTGRPERMPAAVYELLKACQSS